MEPIVHTVTQEAPDLWRFNEGQGYVDAYLLIGQTRAVLIDALQSPQQVSLVDEIRSRTALPVDVLLTHAHGDHAGAEVAKLAAAEGFTLYMSHLDLPIADQFAAMGIDPARIHDIQDGDHFDLGGTVLEAHRVAGHTPGSFCFLDRANRRAFTGDAFGLWLQLPHSLSVADYLVDCRRFEATLADMPDTTLYTGHLSQCGAEPWKAAQVSVTRECCEKLLDGSYEGNELTIPADSPMAHLMAGARICDYKSVKNLVYRPDHLR